MEIVPHSFTADENALIDKLLECGQEHLFEHWPAPGDADEDKKRFMAQATTCDAGYPGGIASYVSNARKLLEDSKRGVNPFDGWTPSVPDGIVVDYASAEHKKLEKLGMQEIGSAAFVSRHVRWVRAVRRGVFGGSASEGPVSGRRFCRWGAPESCAKISA